MAGPIQIQICGTKERGATTLTPTSMVDNMNPVVALALVGRGTVSKVANGGPPQMNHDTRKQNVSLPQAAGA